MKPRIVPQVESCKADWNLFIEKYLRANLDPAQREIVTAIQHNRRVSVRSGHARGKDFLTACVNLAFLHLHKSVRVICTAPTGRQVSSIMMTEMEKLHSRGFLGSEILSNKIRFADDPDRFLIAFKAQDKTTEAWTGYHAQNVLVSVTEASGIDDITMNAIEGVLTGQTSRLLLIFNPNRTTGEAFRSTRSPKYAKFRLSCLDAPNVINKKNIIPGQVDYEWVKDKVGMAGWSTRIEKSAVDVANFLDFEFEGEWYRPSDLFRVKVLGEFPKEGENTVFPMTWLDMGVQRWHDRNGKGSGILRIGADIAGMGVDTTCFALARENTLEEFKVYSKSDHMATVGKLKIAMGPSPDTWAAIDTIGEGAGVYSRAAELNMNVVSAKFSENADGLTDLTGQRRFRNKRAYCYWAFRDALDPNLGGNFAIPPDDELIEELSVLTWDTTSDGRIFINPKDDVKTALGRSPDRGDSAALLFWPRFSGIHYAASSER